MKALLNPTALFLAGFPLLILSAPETKSTLIKGSFPGWNTIDTIFAFGNSYTDIGFRPPPPANITFGGDTTTYSPKDAANQPNPSNPFGVSVYTSPQWFLSETWVAYLTVQYNKSRILTYDLGISGAVVDQKIIERGGSTVDQVETWKASYANLGKTVHTMGGLLSRRTKQHGLTASNSPPPSLSTRRRRRRGGTIPTEAPGTWDPKTTLFTFLIGINDVEISLTNSTVYSSWNKIFASYAAQLKALSDAGARHFLLLGVPAMDLAPGVKSKDKAKLASMIQDWNSRVQRLATNIPLGRPASGGTTTTTTTGDDEGSVWYLDTSALFRELIPNPSLSPATSTITVVDKACPDYGLLSTKPTSPQWKSDNAECTAAYEGYFWRDALHVTGGVHAAIAEAVAAGFGTGGYEWSEEGDT